MRQLSDTFLNNLKSGFLSEITQCVINDHDLTLEIRDSYVNVYYKGNSLLKLVEPGYFRYKAEIHKKFLEGINVIKGINSSLDFTEDSVAQFLSAVPAIKNNIIRYGKHSLEIEYEQMIIRANNFEPRNNSDYFIVDRQYANNDGRFDLTGIFWDRNHRRRGQEVPVCLMEIKFALNTDIKDVHNQLARYYASVKANAKVIAEEMQMVFRQKLELGLYQQDEERLEALKTLTFSTSIDQFQFILIFVDYNPNSSRLDLQNIAKLPFANQIKIFHSGFAMWQQNVKPLSTQPS